MSFSRAQDNEIEEGEVQVYDKDQFIHSGGELFSFQTKDDVQVNWRSIREFDSAFEEQRRL